MNRAMMRDAMCDAMCVAMCVAISVKTRDAICVAMRDAICVVKRDAMRVVKRDAICVVMHDAICDATRVVTCVAMKERHSVAGNSPATRVVCAEGVVNVRGDVSLLTWFSECETVADCKMLQACQPPIAANPRSHLMRAVLAGWCDDASVVRCGIVDTSLRLGTNRAVCVCVCVCVFP